MNEKIRKILAQVMADRKRFAMFIGLFAVGMLLWGRLLIMRNVPRTAVADPKAQSVLAALTGDTPKRVQRVADETGPRVIHATLWDSAQRDLFAIQADLFTPDPEATKVKNPQDQTQAQPVDAQALHRAEIAEQAERLKLQSTILGESPRAMINSTLLAPGQQIEGFAVVRIESRRVLVERGGVLIELKM